MIRDELVQHTKHSLPANIAPEDCSGDGHRAGPGVREDKRRAWLERRRAGQSDRITSNSIEPVAIRVPLDGKLGNPGARLLRRAETDTGD
jgi:hypothetical protein